MKAITKLRLKNFVPSGGHFHVARIEYARGQSPSVHTHDFAEIFWIERGRGVHLINAKRLPLIAGDLVAIRAADRHGFLAQDARGFTMVNVAFASAVPRALRERYFADGQQFPWRDGALPLTVRVDPATLVAVSRFADSLVTAAQSRLQLDCFLLDLLRAIAAPSEPAPSAMPEWLRAALAAFADPAHFAEGTAALARLADRCPEHLNRVVRRHFNKTTTDLVNELRLDHAGKQLQMSGRPILQIATDCGLSNLGYFYRLFHERFGLTPRQFRLRKHAVVQ